MKSKYETHVEPRLKEVTAWAEAGVTEKNIAAALGISYSSLQSYKNRYLDFSKAFTRACAVADEAVENSLYKKCTGYTVKLQKTFKVKRVIYEDGKKVSEKEELVTGYDEVHVPADTNAQIFWLTNRQAEKWKRQPESRENENAGFGGVIEIPAVTEEKEG